RGARSGRGKVDGANKDGDGANASRKAALGTVTAERNKATALAVELAYGRGQSLLEERNDAAGLHWMARALRLAPADDAATRSTIRSSLSSWTRDIHRLRNVLQHAGPVCAVAFSADGKAVLTGSADKTARLWSAADGSPIGKPMAHGEVVGTVAFSPDGKMVLTGSGDTARLWSAADGSPIGKPMAHAGWVRA